MVYLGIEFACQQGRHSKCDGGRPAPKGTFGGTKCTCRCHDFPELHNTIKELEEEYAKLLNMYNELDLHHLDVDEENKRLHEERDIYKEFADTLEEAKITELNSDNWLGRYFKLLQNKLKALEDKP